MVAAGPSPGSTPMTMPISTPTRQYEQIVGLDDDGEPL